MSANKPTANNAVKDTMPYQSQTEDVSNSNSGNAIYVMMQRRDNFELATDATQSGCRQPGDESKGGLKHGGKIGLHTHN
jgi:hypothetical protein